MPGINEYASPQWRDLNEWRSFPFSDKATLTLSTGTTLPTSLLVDARLYIPGLAGVLSLLSVEITRESAVITIGKLTSQVTATATLNFNNPRPVLLVKDAFGNASGVLVAGSTQWAELSSLDLGLHNFEVGTADFVPAVCVAVPDNRQRLLGPNGESLGDVVRLVGENGVQLLTDYDEHGSLIVTVNVVGDPLYQLSECDVDAARVSQVIRTVIFQSGDTLVECNPNGEGRIFVFPATYDQPNAAMRVTTEEQGLRFALEGKSLETG